MKRLLRTGTALLIGLAIFLAAAELLLRASGFSAPIWYQPDALLGWSMRPGAEGWFTKEGRAYVKINAAGFRDSAHALDKAPGVYRIAVLGDSVPEAMQLDMRATFWWRLQEELGGCQALAGRKVEAMAFGVSGYGTAQEALMLETVVAPYRPDLVLLAFAPNDIRNNSARLEPEDLRPFFRVAGGELQLDQSFTARAEYAHRASPAYQAYRSASDWLRMVQLVQAARHGIDTLRQAGSAHAGGTTLPGIEPTTPISLFAPPRDAAWEEAWTITERLLARMHRYAARHEMRFALVALTHSAQVHPDAATRKNLQDALGQPDLFYIERRLQALGRQEGFSVIALAPELQRRADAERIFFHGFENYRVGWGHWNAQGHRAAAELIAAGLCSQL